MNAPSTSFGVYSHVYFEAGSTHRPHRLYLSLLGLWAMNKCGQIHLPRKVQQRARVQLLLESQESHNVLHNNNNDNTAPAAARGHPILTPLTHRIPPSPPSLLLQLCPVGVGLFDLFMTSLTFYPQLAGYR